MTSNETQIQIFADWPMSHAAKCMTKGNRKNPEYHVVAAIKIKRLRRQSKTVPQKNHGQTILQMNSISDLKRSTAPKVLNSPNNLVPRAFSLTWGPARKPGKRPWERGCSLKYYKIAQISPPLKN